MSSIEHSWTSSSGSAVGPADFAAQWERRREKAIEQSDDFLLLVASLNNYLLPNQWRVEPGTSHETEAQSLVSEIEVTVRATTGSPQTEQNEFRTNSFPRHEESRLHHLLTTQRLQNTEPSPESESQSPSETTGEVGSNPDHPQPENPISQERVSAIARYRSADSGRVSHAKAESPAPLSDHPEAMLELKNEQEAINELTVFETTQDVVPTSPLDSIPQISQTSTDTLPPSETITELTEVEEGMVPIQMERPLTVMGGKTLAEGPASSLAPRTLAAFMEFTAQQAQLVTEGGRQHFQLKLDPIDLGEVVIEIEKGADGAFSVRIAAAQAETRTLFHLQAQDISEALNTRQGLNVAEFSVLGEGEEGFQHGSPDRREHVVESKWPRPPHVLNPRPKDTAPPVNELEINFRA